MIEQTMNCYDCPECRSRSVPVTLKTEDGCVLLEGVQREVIKPSAPYEVTGGRVMHWPPEPFSFTMIGLRDDLSVL